jgi:hypothetical protein
MKALHAVAALIHGLRAEASHVVYFMVIEHAVRHWILGLDWDRVRTALVEVVATTLITKGGF